MTAAKPGKNLPKTRPARRRYINAGTEQLLRDCFPGMIPAAVIEQALAEKARREGRLEPRRPA
ncbi:hypothetical protein [Streptomyces sp. NPDC005732]|uniref:hypothetical protein n=1 Tax=Streptomyces sp. NPDC005732 TaxID=3157057 RepID=UPI0033D084A7